MILPRGCRCSSGGARPAAEDRAPASWSVSGALFATSVDAERLTGRVDNVGRGDEPKRGDHSMQNKWWIKLVALAALLSAPAKGQIWVYDPAAVTQLINQATQMAAQLQQLQSIQGGLNKLTNMGDVAALLNNPAIRSALPQGFARVQSSLTSGGGGYGSQFTSGNQTYASPGNTFYAQELARQQGINAGQMGLAQQMYDAATARMAGIEQLRQQLNVSLDAKTTLDLTARLGIEQAYLQIDINRMQALAMLQQAQVQVASTRQTEQDQKHYDAYRQQFPDIGGN